MAGLIIEPFVAVPRIPLYRQVKEHVRKALLSPGDGSQNQILFTDKELVQSLQVSRMTVRKALEELVAEGRLTRVRGVGTFAPLPHLRTPVQSIERVVSDWQLDGHEVTGETLACRTEACPDPWAGLLGLPTGSPAAYVCRRRYADLVPMALDYRYLPLEVGAHLFAREVAQESLAHLLARKLSMEITAARAEFGAVAADSTVAKLLLVKTGTPLLTRQVVIHSEERVVIVGHSLFRSDIFRYIVTYP